MSTAVSELPVSIGVPGQSGQTEHAQRIVGDSAVRWMWEPFKDISFMGPRGREVKNTIEPEIGDEGELIFCGMRRCTPYPLMNHEYNVPRHEQVGFDPPASFGNFGINEELATEPINTPLYARVCAEELMGKYAIEYGMITLAPLTGITDSRFVEKVFTVVQPLAYKLHNLEQELTIGASARAAEIKDEEIMVNGEAKKLSDIAEGCRRLMLIGARRALTTAQEQYGEFYKDIQSFVGSKMGRSSALAHDAFIADQLDLELPTVVKAAPQQGENPKVVELLERLTESATQKNLDTSDMSERMARMETEQKATTARLEAQVAELLAAKVPEPKTEKKK